MRFKAIAFDAYGTLLNIHSVENLCESLFPGHGRSLTQLWRDKQIEYTRLRTLTGRYEPFWTITRDALRFSCAALKLQLAADTEQKLMDQYAILVPFEENIAVLNSLKELDIPIAVLTNANPDMVQTALQHSQMSAFFDYVLSADTVKKFKPAPEVYQLGPDAFGCAAEDIVFVSSNAWDIVGSMWFGYHSFWVNRSHAPMEQLGVQPYGEGHTLVDLLAFIKRS